MCECDFKTKTEYYKLIDDMKPNEYEPVIFDSDKDPCNKKPTAITENKNSVNNQVISIDPATAVLDVIQPDSLPLLNYSNGAFTISQYLPLTYYSSTEKIIFTESYPTIKIEVYPLDGSKKFLTGKIEQNCIVTNDSTMFSFRREDGALCENRIGENRVQLAQQSIE